MDDRETKEAWLERAMEQYEESLLRMCFAYLGDAALAEDAVQDTAGVTVNAEYNKDINIKDNNPILTL